MDWNAIFLFVAFLAYVITNALLIFIQEQAWSLILAAFGILGIYLAGSRNLWGWIISFSMQGLWITYAIVTEQYGFIASSLGYAWVYGRNFIKWRRDKKKEEAA